MIPEGSYDRPAPAADDDLVETLAGTPHRLIIGHTRGGKTTLIHHMATAWAAQGSAAVWFFYLLTAAINSLFVLSYSPGLPSQVQAITPGLSLLGAILLGLLVPVSIAALERARQVADMEPTRSSRSRP
ncbi:hypothetical protein EKD04_023525 [Chloroflexales bacterium ZM16-3]|nr:hypothetical protein [Chloroflexales bacterium ZM16-3]